MSFLERVRPDALLEQIREHRAVSLPTILITLLVLAAVILILITLWPGLRERQILVDELSVARSLSEQQAQLPRPDHTSLSAQAAALRQDLLKAQAGFISETEADAVLNQIYGYAVVSNIAIESLQVQSAGGEEGEQQLPQTAFRLTASGSSIQLLNFVARINQASLPGVELNNLSLVPGEPADIAVLIMDIHFHTIPQILDPPTPAPPTPEPEMTPTPTVTPEELSPDQ